MQISTENSNTVLCDALRRAARDFMSNLSTPPSPKSIPPTPLRSAATGNGKLSSKKVSGNASPRARAKAAALHSRLQALQADADAKKAAAATTAASTAVERDANPNPRASSKKRGAEEVVREGSPEIQLEDDDQVAPNKRQNTA